MGEVSLTKPLDRAIKTTGAHNQPLISIGLEPRAVSFRYEEVIYAWALMGQDQGKQFFDMATDMSEGLDFLFFLREMMQFEVKHQTRRAQIKYNTNNALEAMTGHRPPEIWTSAEYEAVTSELVDDFLCRKRTLQECLGEIKKLMWNKTLLDANLVKDGHIKLNDDYADSIQLKLRAWNYPNALQMTYCFTILPDTKNGGHYIDRELMRRRVELKQDGKALMSFLSSFKDFDIDRTLSVLEGQIKADKIRLHFHDPDFLTYKDVLRLWQEEGYRRTMQTFESNLKDIVGTCQMLSDMVRFEQKHKLLDRSFPEVSNTIAAEEINNPNLADRLREFRQTFRNLWSERGLKSFFHVIMVHVVEEQRSLEDDHEILIGLMEQKLMHDAILIQYYGISI